MSYLKCFWAVFRTAKRWRFSAPERLSDANICSNLSYYGRYIYQQVVLYIATKPAPLWFVDSYSTLPTACVCLSWFEEMMSLAPLASSPLLAHCCSFSLLSPVTTHPEYEAVGDEESLQAGDHRLRLKPPRRRRHGDVASLSWKKKERKVHFTAPWRGQGGKKLRDESKEKGGSVVTGPDSLSWRSKRFSTTRPSVKSAATSEAGLRHGIQNKTRSSTPSHGWQISGALLKWRCFYIFLIAISTLKIRSLTAG